MEVHPKDRACLCVAARATRGVPRAEPGAGGRATRPFLRSRRQDLTWGAPPASEDLHWRIGNSARDRPSEGGAAVLQAARHARVASIVCGVFRYTGQGCCWCRNCTGTRDVVVPEHVRHKAKASYSAGTAYRYTISAVGTEDAGGGWQICARPTWMTSLDTTSTI